MLIPEIQQNLINRLLIDPYGKVSAVLVLNKPVGISSHDLVDDVRKILRTRKVGHAGALDPFASGVMILLVGKYTKYTEAVINFNKSYRAGIVLGLKTLTQDPEGEILEQQSISLETLIDNLGENPSSILLEKIKSKFMPEYKQTVPIFSSVKVSGNKLRVLARKASEIKFHSNAEVEFIFDNGEENLIVDLPQKIVQVKPHNLNNLVEVHQTIADNFSKVSGDFIKFDLDVDVSKGTYIRQLAQDIGDLLAVPSFLESLVRTQVGPFTITSAIKIPELFEISQQHGILTKETELDQLNLNTEV